MYTYIKDHRLFILNYLTGRIYWVSLSPDGQDIMIIHEDTMSFKADVDRCIKENNATLIRD